jgi:hypothetical protein
LRAERLGHDKRPAGCKRESVRRLAGRRMRPRFAEPAVGLDGVDDDRVGTAFRHDERRAVGRQRHLRAVRTGRGQVAACPLDRDQFAALDPEALRLELPALSA